MHITSLTLWPLYGPAGSTQGHNQLFIGRCSFCAESQCHCGDASLCFQLFLLLISFCRCALLNPPLHGTQTNGLFEGFLPFLLPLPHAEGLCALCQQASRFFFPLLLSLLLSNKQIRHNKSAAGNGQRRLVGVMKKTTEDEGNGQ